jgi:hypothetical protein
MPLPSTQEITNLNVVLSWYDFSIEIHSILHVRNGKKAEDRRLSVSS